MKPIVIAALLAAPLPALAQQAPETHDEAQRIVRAEAERWRYPLIDADGTRYPDIFGVIVTRDAAKCETLYTITYPAFTARGGKPHPEVVRDVEMYWDTSTRLAIVNGTMVSLTWRTKGGGSFDWSLETETPQRAQAFAAAADFLTNECTLDESGAKPAQK